MFCRFSICMAWYAFLSENYSGQTDSKYARLCGLTRQFKPGPLFKGYDSLLEHEKMIYDDLTVFDKANPGHDWNSKRFQTKG